MPTVKNVMYPDSELILNDDGSVYHLRLRPEQLADTVILVGDPERVSAVSRHFDSIEHTVQSREFVTHTGWVGSTRISCVSHGIGCDNIDIVLNELDALAGIDLENRCNLEVPRSLTMVRIGTSGSLHPDLLVDNFVASAWAIGLDGLLNYYPYEKTLNQEEIESAFIRHCDYPQEYCRPYAFQADNELLALFESQCMPGITLTAPGFYAPQGRSLRLKVNRAELTQRFESFASLGYPVTNFEMETSAIYGLGSLGGHRACTVCAVIANRLQKAYSKNAHKTVDRLITFVLEKLVHEQA
jgi:uridine phosphorylase